MQRESIGNYDFVFQIGSGSFATVWLARHRFTGLNVAIKIISRSSLNTQESITRFQRETSLLKQMNHPFITELFEIIEDEEAFYLVMEYVEHGNMLDFINKNGRLTEDKARRYFCQLVSSLEYIHDQKFVAHRDLKAENVMLDRYDNIRLIDFGLSNQFTKRTPELMTACGSPAYASPEMILGNPYTKAADIWSSGILLYAMVAGRLPYYDQDIQTLLSKIVKTEITYPSVMSPSLVDLLKRMLLKDPNQRITLSRLKEHPWFSKSEYTALMNLNFMNNLSFHPTECAIDRDIIDQMTVYGIDCKFLPQSILTGEFNENTAIYRMLRKNKITEKMKDIMSCMAKMKNENFIPPAMRKKDSPPLRMLPSVIRVSPNVVSIRRMSRPIAMRRVMVVQPENNEKCFETP
ncbi:CAMK family protein kinase [Histomonas meleagridis]|uniref:CAMK family protein kinase n=1 Tax=Histomonas meleagridis TaxID=135588 RepID=UPI00355AA6E0|nr:CAMK family protein kinase [Histomonas meleagridis]KAH0806187.1 CAMK family protein kinase [Histomonas meleagridis]